jgi:anthranilate phosphoribosyltransferase
MNDEDQGAHADALVLGAGLLLEVTGRAADLNAGIAQAREAIASGAAKQQLASLRHTPA